MKYEFETSLNLLTTKSDWYLISLYHITPESNIGADHGL